MDAEELQQLKPKLQDYLKRFDDCFSVDGTRNHLPVYVEGQLSDLPEKTLAPIAANAGVAPRTLQEFLSMLHWDQDRMRDRLEQIVATEHAGPHAVGILDETSFVKKGDKTPGVKRQWCGTLGKEENCVVTVHLAYARGEFHCLLDGELFLPEDWSADRQRCREAGIPDEMQYRPKWQIGLELYDRAIANGIRFEWITFDEGYGGKPAFLQGLNERNQPFIGEVPSNFSGWIDPPRVTERPYRHEHGRGRTKRRLVAGSGKARGVRWLLHHHLALRDQPWQPYRVKDGEKGPMIWNVKRHSFYPKMGRLPLKEHQLLIAQDVLKPNEIKFFVSNAPSKVKTEHLLLAAFSRWHVERCFEDGKQKVGLDDFEGRCYLGLKRHLAVSAVSFLFLAQVQATWAGKKSGVDDRAGADGHGGDGAALVAGRADLDEVAGFRPQSDARSATRRGESPSQPHSAHTAKTTGNRHQTHQDPPVPLGHKLAL